jgi:hypothetical protein
MKLRISSWYATMGVVAALALGLSRPAAADSLTLNFDTDFNSNPLINGTPLDMAYPMGGYPMGAPTIDWSDDALVILSGGGVPSQPNFAATAGFQGAIDAVFSGLVDSVSVTNVTFSAFTMYAFDINNNILSSQSVVNFGSPLTSITLNHPGQIASVGFRYLSGQGLSGYGFDDFTYTWTNGGGSEVPEPGAVALLVGAGVTGAGVLARRRRNK